MEENEAIVYIFERKVLKDNNKTQVSAFIPVEVVIGTELSFKDLGGLKVLHTDNSAFGENKEFNLLNDVNAIGDKYVYAFPCYIEGRTSRSIESTIKTLNEELPSLENRVVYQIFYKEENFAKEFFYNDTIDSAISIDAEDSYSLYDIIYRDFNGIKEIADEIERKKDRILILDPIIDKDDHTIYSDDIYKNVSRTVICQDEQIKKIATAISKNMRLDGPNLKSNMLVCGPTGVGKSEIFRCIGKYCNIPVVMEDSTEYTAASYKGKDVAEMLVHLYEASEGDIEKAQRGILVIDEIDKKVSKSGEHDTYTTAVITQFLKMMEGHIYHINVGKQEVEFDTSNLTFAFLGAFSGIENYSRKRRSLGFVSNEDAKDEENTKNSYNDETLKKFGMLPEFLGRNDTIVVMDNLGQKEFEKIIRESDKSQLLLYRDLFDDIGIKFIYDDKVIEAIAKKCIELGVGARSIKKIVENALEIANYSIFSRNKYKELIITPETIEDNKKFILK